MLNLGSKPVSFMLLAVGLAAVLSSGLFLRFFVYPDLISKSVLFQI